MKRGQGRREGVFYSPAGGKSGRVRFRFCTLSGRQGAFSAKAPAQIGARRMKRGQGRRKGVFYAPAGGKSGRVRFPALHAFGPPRGHFRGESALPCAFAAKTVFSARTATDAPPEAQKMPKQKFFGEWANERIGEWAAKTFFVKAELAARAEKSRARAASQKTRIGRGGRRQKNASHVKREAATQKNRTERGGRRQKNASHVKREAAAQKIAQKEWAPPQKLAAAPTLSFSQKPA